MPNNYVTNPYNVHGTIRFNEIVPFSEKDILNFEQLMNRKRIRLQLN
jgi:hypothetical protein